MEPSARALYKSLRATSTLPAHLQILPAHGAGSACGKSLGAVPTSVLGYERQYNGALREALEGSEHAFVKDILSGQPEPPRYFARMKRDNKAGPALLPGGKLPQPHRLQGNEIAARVAGGKTVILDLRGDRKEFMKQHLTGSLFAPLAGGKLPLVAGSYVEENAAIILLVNDANEVEQAVRELVRIGLEKVEAWIPVGEALALDGVTRRQKSITTAELADHAGATVLDVRSAAEFAESHVRGAKNIAYTRLAARLGEVPDAHPLYVHCCSGMRAGFAVAYLAGKGREVVHVDGPFDAIPAGIKQ